MPVKPAEHILKVLAYFDIFNYPLTKEEIQFFLGIKMPSGELQDCLRQMAAQQQLHQFQEFFTLQNNAALIERRLAGNARARTMLPVAYRIASFLFQFPFVRGIGISGSLSKNFADEHADIDFFIITSANRLWIARTIMHLFKKCTFLTGRQHLYCMNYYVDETALRIEEQNIFTATELITLVPVCGADALRKFSDHNAWVAHFFPNTGNKPVVLNTCCAWYKKFAEWMLNNKVGNAFDNYLMKLTSRRWQRKEQAQRRNANGNRMGLHNTKHVSKPNPVYFQQRILDAYANHPTIHSSSSSLSPRSISTSTPAA